MLHIATTAVLGDDSKVVGALEFDSSLAVQTVVNIHTTCVKVSRSAIPPKSYIASTPHLVPDAYRFGPAIGAEMVVPRCTDVVWIWVGRSGSPIATHAAMIIRASDSRATFAPRRVMGG
jgi:hypothetical protein